MNLVIMNGRLTKDPVLENLGTNKTPHTRVRIAVDNGKAADGTRRPATFVDVEFWAKAAEVLCNTVKQGDEIILNGSYQVDQFTTKAGEKAQKVYVLARSFEYGKAKREGTQAQPIQTSEQNSYDDIFANIPVEEDDMRIV